MPKQWLSVFAICVGMFVSPVRGEEIAVPTPELDKLRAIYSRELDALRAKGLRAHVAKLTALEESLLLSGDLKSAEQVRAARTARQSELEALSRPQTNLAGEPLKPVSLHVAEAKLTGTVKRSATTLSNWRTAASSATWSKRDLPPGRYDVYLDYFAIRGGGGPIEVRELHQVTEVTIPPARGGASRASLKVATFDLRAAIHLKISSKGRGNQGIFYLSGVRLVPAGSASDR